MNGPADIGPGPNLDAVRELRVKIGARFRIRLETLALSEGRSKSRAALVEEAIDALWEKRVEARRKAKAAAEEALNDTPRSLLMTDIGSKSEDAEP